MTPDPAPSRPASGTGAPRPEGDAIAVDIATRAGPVTVVFTSPAHARARPAGQAFSYRGRYYTGSVHLMAPSWRGSPGLGMSLYPAGSPAGCGVAAAIAAQVGAAVADWLSDHRDVLDMAAQAQAAAARARAQRDLELLEPEITAVRQHLDELHRKQDQLRATAAGPGRLPDPSARPSATTGSIDPRFGTATMAVSVADEKGDTGRPGQRAYFDLHPDPHATSRPPEAEAQR